MRIDVNGVGIEVDDQGAGEGNGETVLLIHGWPDTHALWDQQVAALRGAGYRTIAPDVRGFGASDKPEGVEHYAIPFLFTDLVGVLDHLGVDRVHVVGHDWGAAIAWVFAILAPDRVQSVTALSVGHPASFSSSGMPQREKSWYMLLFQFAGVAEQWLMQNDWANFREWSRHPAADEVAARLANPADLTATLNLYRANVPPEALIGEPLRRAADHRAGDGRVERPGLRADRGPDARFGATRDRPVALRDHHRRRSLDDARGSGPCERAPARFSRVGVLTDADFPRVGVLTRGKRGEARGNRAGGGEIPGRTRSSSQLPPQHLAAAATRPPHSKHALAALVPLLLGSDRSLAVRRPPNIPNSCHHRANC